MRQARQPPDGAAPTGAGARLAEPRADRRLPDPRPAGRRPRPRRAPYRLSGPGVSRPGGAVHRIESLNAYVGCPRHSAARGVFLHLPTCGDAAEFDDDELTATLLWPASGARAFEVESSKVELSGLVPARSDCQLVSRISSRGLAFGRAHKWTMPAGFKIQNPSRSGGSFSTSSHRTTPGAGEMRTGRGRIWRDHLEPHLRLGEMRHSIDPEPDRPESNAFVPAASYTTVRFSVRDKKLPLPRTRVREP